MDDQYDLIPHKEIQDLKEELQKLREFPAGPAARLQISLSEVSQKIDKIIRIFEEALHNTQTEGGLSVQERLKPINTKIDTLMEQQQEIAKGMIELADLITSMKKTTDAGLGTRDSRYGTPTNNYQPQQFNNQPPAPSLQTPAYGQPPMPPRGVQPPLPPRKQ